MAYIIKFAEKVFYGLGFGLGMGTAFKITSVRQNRPKYRNKK